MDTLKEFRLRRGKQTAAKHNADALILSLPENIEYYTDFHSTGMEMLYSTENYLVYDPFNGRMGLIVSAADIPTVFESGYTGSIYPVGEFKFAMPGDDEFTLRLKDALARRFPSAAAAVRAALAEVAPKAETIAVDEARMPVSTWKALESTVTGVRLVSGTQLLYEIKSIKHPEEINRLRDAAQLAEDCFMSAVSRICIGKSEHDMEADYKREAAIRGCDPYFFIATVDYRAAFSDTKNRSFNKVKNGSMLRFDFGCVHKSFRSDLARTAIMRSNDKAEAYYAAILEGQQRAIEAVMPGVTAGEVFNAAVTETRKAGIPHYERHHVGHGIGIATYDWPSITEGNATALEEGMVLCIETPYYEIGWGGVQVEDTVLVTATGAQYLNKTSRELIKLEP